MTSNSSETKYNWAAIRGKFDFDGDLIVFRGATNDLNGQPISNIGQLICDRDFVEGAIEATVVLGPGDPAMCEIMLFYDPQTKFTLTAGLGAGTAYAVRFTDGREWQTLAYEGDRSNLIPGKPYRLVVQRSAGLVSIVVDGVEVLRTRLPWTLPRSQVGLSFWGANDIRVTKFRVMEQIPRAFVVMQFTPPFDDLYHEVIRPVCEEFGIEARRADDTFGPGVILQDIVKQINESRLIIAEISPPNPNVFYEVGYAHAMNKPTILIATKNTQLPFDVSGFRTLFYEDSISGKKKIEEGLRRHVKEIVDPAES